MSEHTVFALFIVLVLVPLIGLLALTVVLRHRRKMALIQRGLNPDEPNLLKFFRRGLLALFLGIGSLLLSLHLLGKGKSDEGHFWAAVAVVTLAVGGAYLIYYRKAKLLLPSPASSREASPPIATKVTDPPPQSF